MEVLIRPTYEVAANLIGPLQTMFEFLRIGRVTAWFVENYFEMNLNWSLLDINTGLQDLISRADDLPEWNVAKGAALMVRLPPVPVVLSMQCWFLSKD